MAKPFRKSVLFATSSGSDLQVSGGVISITGLTPVSKRDILAIKQIKSRAEVKQVVTVGATAYIPAANTPYKVAVFDPNRTRNGYQEQPKVYVAQLGTITGVAATDREAVTAILVAAINADNTNDAVAVSLGSGNGFTITDDGGYYPVKSQTSTNVLGVNTVYTIVNPDGTGFSATNFSVTTPAVLSSGIGANLLTQKVVADLVFGGNIISGDPEDQALTTAGLPATAGQNYDIFSIDSLLRESIPTVSDVEGFIRSSQIAYVDNGTGSSTANLAGFLAFERAARKNISQLYANDTDSWIEFFDSPTLFQGAGGAVPTTTGENKVSTSYGQFVYNQVGTQTITVPTPGNTGLILDQDLTATEGAEYTPSLLTNNSQSFVIGKDECSLTLKTIAADHTDANLYVGFRIKAAHAADFNNYTDLAAIGYLGDLVYTWGILNNAATVATNTTVVPTDASVEEFVIKVDINGVVTTSRNGVVYPVYSAGTTPMVFDAGDTIIPFVLNTNIGGGDPDLIVSQLISVSDVNWLV